MRHLILITLSIFALSGLALAQGGQGASVEKVAPVPSEVAKPNGIGIKPASTPFSLLDLSRVKWSHSYSVSFFSGGGTSGSLGRLNTTMFYELSSKLSLTLNLGLLHNTSALWGQGNHDATFLPGFRLDYRPSKNVYMTVSFQTISGYDPYYWGRGYRYYDPLLMGR